MSDQYASNDFYTILDEIRKRPTLYLPRHSIFDLQAFYYGYDFARQRNGLPETQQDMEFGEFLDWLRQICPVKTNHAWANLLLFYSIDERDALDKFFGLLDDFKLQKADSENIRIDQE
jgi:hypothetical protein